MIIEIFDTDQKKLLITRYPQWVHVEQDGTQTICLQEEANCISVDNVLYTINGRYIPQYLIDKNLPSVYIGMFNEDRLLSEEKITELFNWFVDGKMCTMQQFKHVVTNYIKTLPEEEQLKVPELVCPWYSDHDYCYGDIFTFDVNSVGDPQLYKVIKDHKSTPELYPPEHPQLYKKLGVDDNNIPLWQPSFGKQDAYDKDDIVIIEGKKYKSLINENVFGIKAPWFNDVWEEVIE